MRLCVSDVRYQDNELEWLGPVWRYFDNIPVTEPQPLWCVSYHSIWRLIISLSEHHHKTSVYPNSLCALMHSWTILKSKQSQIVWMQFYKSKYWNIYLKARSVAWWWMRGKVKSCQSHFNHKSYQSWPSARRGSKGGKVELF